MLQSLHRKYIVGICTYPLHILCASSLFFSMLIGTIIYCSQTPVCFTTIYFICSMLLRFAFFLNNNYVLIVLFVYCEDIVTMSTLQHKRRSITIQEETYQLLLQKGRFQQSFDSLLRELAAK